MTVETFEAYATDRPDARFTEWLRERSEPAWTDAVDVRFVRELDGETSTTGSSVGTSSRSTRSWGR